LAHCARGADDAPPLRGSDDGGTESTDESPELREEAIPASGKEAVIPPVPGLRAEDGDPSVGGRTRDSTCAVPEEDKPKLRGGDEQEVDAETKVLNANKAKKARAQAAANAAAKAKAAADKAAALARPENGSLVIVDSTELVDHNAHKFFEEIKQALSGGEDTQTALRDSVLDFLGGQWVNSLVVCEVHEFANGTIIKVPYAVQNYTSLFGLIYENATMHGDAQCQYWLGRMYEFGLSVGEGEGEEMVPQDANQAAQLYMAAGDHVPAANRALGDLLQEHGDIDSAASLYTKSLELGDVRSLALLGRLYENHGSVAEALDLYTQGANLEESLAMGSLAVLLLEGNGVTKDVPKAIEFLTKAAARLESSAFYILGTLLESGEGVAKNIKQAFNFYEIAANLGHGGAAVDLARLYNGVDGIEPDSDKALSWLQKAAVSDLEGDSHDVNATAEYATLSAPLQGGRPSRYEYVPITTYPLSKEEKAAQDALGFTGTEPAPGVGETARYRYMSGADYFKMPSVIWDVADAAAQAA